MLGGMLAFAYRRSWAGPIAEVTETATEAAEVDRSHWNV